MQIDFWHIICHSMHISNNNMTCLCYIESFSCIYPTAMYPALISIFHGSYKNAKPLMFPLNRLPMAKEQQAAAEVGAKHGKWNWAPLTSMFIGRHLMQRSTCVMRVLWPCCPVVQLFSCWVVLRPSTVPHLPIQSFRCDSSPMLLSVEHIKPFWKPIARF